MSQEKYLTEDQIKHIYDKVESVDEIRVRKVNQEIWNNKMLPHKNLKGKEEINLYEKVLVSDINTIHKNKS